MVQLAFVFPGQGSQSVGMLQDYHASYAIVRETFEEACDLLQQDLWEVIALGSADALNQTVNTQPIMFVASMAIWRLFCQMCTQRPAVAAGHSLGEYSALVSANALSFTDALRVIKLRAELMQNAVPVGQGGMAAILGLADADVEALCMAAKINDEVLAAVNYNSPGQVVIAGNIASVNQAISMAKPAGAKLAKMLPVSVPSHCALMASAEQGLQEILAGITLRATDFPVYKNTDAMPHAEVNVMRDALAEQVVKPVRWSDSITNMTRQFDDLIFVECGPNKVLSGLNKRIDKNTQAYPLADVASFDKLMAAIN